MVWVSQRERELIGRVAPVILRRFDDLAAEWRAAVGSQPTADLPALTRAALEDGIDAAIAQQRRLAQWLVAQGVPLDRVVSSVLSWEEILLRRLARDAMEDIFTGASALNRFLHALVLMMAEGYWQQVREERDQIRRGLDDADRLKTELISMVSHDLQTPLTTITGAVSSMLEADVDDAQRARFLRLIEQNADRLSRLITQILDLSSIEARAVHLDITEIDLAATVRRLVEGILPTAPVRVEVQPDVPSVLADRDAVERILVNLVDNAVRLSPKGEPVLVEASRAGAHVELRVIDRGPGIPSDRRDGLFSKFYQVDTSPSGRRTGTGLGLAIVRGLAEAMGGGAGYRPNRPAGSVFWVTLRVADEHAVERAG